MAEFCCVVAQNALGNVLGNLADRTLKLTSNPIILVFKMKPNVENLKKQVTELKDVKENVEHCAQAAERRGEEIERTLKNWLKEVSEFIETSNTIEDDEEKAKKKCFFGMCLNPLSRYKLSKKAREDSKYIVNLVEKAREFNLQVSYLPILQREMAATVKGFQEFKSTVDILDEIMKALQSPNINIIGVHGMPGVGKTMLLKEVKRKAEQEKLFDVVVMASVTKTNPDLRTIQDEMAYGLGLHLPSEIEHRTAADRFKVRFLKERKVLVILDDIWDRLDLEALGIPFKYQQKMNVETSSSSTEDQQMTCKILLSSRELNVLSNKMGTQKNVAVNQLKDEEALQLFKKIVGDQAESSELQRTSTDIVTECKGLPLAIATIAEALKNKSSYEWSSALQKLTHPSARNFSGINAKVYTAIELSYNNLESGELRQIFLLSSFMGHNALVQDLLKYGVGLGLFSQSNTIEEARDEVLTLISNLKASSLFIDGSDKGRFDIHDVIRDVALSIAQRDKHGLFLIDDCLLNESTDEKALNDFKWIWLEYANMIELPNEFESPQLTFFHLSNKCPSLEIPATFFKGTQKLRVLHLTGMQMLSLPSSICLLKNLRTLCLDQGTLEDIRVIGELKNLEILSLCRSCIKMLPKEIGQLTRLQLLDLSGCTKLEVIPPGVLASMSRLEELYLGNSFNKWEHDEHENQQSASLFELKHLKKLTALEVQILEARVIPEDLFFEKLKRYKIFIGVAWNKWDSSPERSRILKLQLRVSTSFDSFLKQLLKMSEELHLEELKGVKNILYELDSEGFQELKYLYIHNAPNIQHIINSARIHNAFPNLEVLSICNLVNLEKICYGWLRATSFCRLRIITVERCNQLKMLLSFSMARQLLQLQEIGVADCRNIVEIVDGEEKKDVGDTVEVTNQIVELGQLLSLRLQYLPKFISFSHENDTSSGHVPLFSEKFVIPYLEKLQLSCIAITTIWHTSATSYCTQNLTALIIEGCDNLEHLFSSSMARGLVKLRLLKINQCKKVREIIMTENVKEMENLISLPKLDFLLIQDLQNLVKFYSGNCIIEVPSLKQLTIQNCPKLKEFMVKPLSTDVAADITPLFNDQLEVYNLEMLKLSANINIHQIWHNRIPALSSFAQKLTQFTVEDCDNLKYLFTSSMAKSLEHLKWLNVRNCEMMERVIVIEGFTEEERMQKMSLPQLQALRLINLPNLKRFCFGNYIEFPCLTGLIISKCPVLKTFISSPIIGDIAASTKQEENTSTPALFDAKVAVPNLEVLVINGMENLNKIWHNQLDAESFCKLSHFSVTDCETIVSIFPFNTLEILQGLNVLHIARCESLEEIFEPETPIASNSQALVATHEFVFPKLTELQLFRLPKLKGLCQPMHITKFPSLKKLVVDPSARKIFFRPSRGGPSS